MHWVLQVKIAIRILDLTPAAWGLTAPSRDHAPENIFYIVLFYCAVTIAFHRFHFIGSRCSYDTISPLIYLFTRETPYHILFFRAPRAARPPRTRHARARRPAIRGKSTVTFSKFPVLHGAVRYGFLPHNNYHGVSDV
jgi:hypothetical protein